MSPAAWPPLSLTCCIFHFTPLHASWVDQIELLFGIYSRRVLRHASHTSTAHLPQRTEAFIAQRNISPEPFKWTFAGFELQTGEPKRFARNARPHAQASPAELQRHLAKLTGHNHARVRPYGSFEPLLIGKHALAVARHFDAHRAILGVHGLGAVAVALIARVLGPSGAGRVAQVVRQLAAQGALDQRLLQRDGRGVDLIGRHRPFSHDLVEQFLRDLRQRRGLGGYRRVLQFRAAWLDVAVLEPLSAAGT